VVGGEQGGGPAGDLQVLARGDHHGPDGCVRRADVAVGGGPLVHAGVDPHPEVGQPGRHPRAHERGVLADAAGHHEQVQPPGRGGHPGDLPAQVVDEHVEGERAVRVPLRSPGEHVAQVPGRPG
jgi:hypothetical protein